MKRILFVYAILIAFGVIIVISAYRIMIVDGEKYRDAAVKQSGILINTDNGRGNIYDRNNLKFTSFGKIKKAVIVKSDNPDRDFEACGILCTDDPYGIYNDLYKNGVAYCDVAWDFNENLISEYKNAYVYEDTVRYSDDGTSAVTIGYISDGAGVTGVEYVADRYLKNGDSGRFYITKDANGRLLPGLSFKKNQNPDRLMLKTTLDKRYSEICSKALEDKKGAAVMLEIPSFDLVAMVSSPTFNANRPEQYFGSADSPFLNRATSDYDMGSIFKIVVTAAALENNSISSDDKFYCNGIKKVGDVNFLCENHTQKPYLTLNDAFIHSCNSVFIDIGQKTSYNNIIDMACAFGLGEKLVYPQTFPQSKGILPDTENYYLADEANLSIGQGRLMGTPVHGAYFSAVIANGGVRNKINILDSLLDEKGNQCINLKEYGEKRILDKGTAKVIYEMMCDTVTNGTGSLAGSVGFSSAGKTGSAQTGMRENGEPQVHAWFTGFFPADNPKYALCVFIENGKSGGAEAAPLFKEISEKVAKAEGW